MASFIIFLEPDEYPLHGEKLYNFLDKIGCEFKHRGVDKRFRPYYVVETNGKINEQGLSDYKVDEVRPWDGKLPP